METYDQIIERAIQGHASTRDAIRWAMKVAVKAERERCAALCEALGEDGSLMFQQAAEKLAKAIRESE